MNHKVEYFMHILTNIFMSDKRMCFNLWRNLDVVQVYDRSCNNSGYPYFPQWARVCADRIANICNQTKDCRAILLSSGSLRSTLHWFCLKKVAKHDIDPFYHLRLPAIYTTLWSASVRFTPLPTQHVQAHCGLHTHTNPPWSAAVSMEFWNWKLAPLDFSVLAWNLGDLQQNKNSFFVYSCFFIFPHCKGGKCEVCPKNVVGLRCYLRFCNFPK